MRGWRATLSSLPLREAALVAASLGLLETALTYGTGYAPATDVLLILACDCVLVAILVALIALGGRLLRAGPNGVARTVDAGLLLVPVALFAVRGNVDPSQVNPSWGPLLRWGVSGALLVALGAAFSRMRSVTGSLPAISHFFARALFSQAAVVGLFAVRTIDLTAAADLLRAEWQLRLAACGGVVLLAHLAAIVWRLKQRLSGAESGGWRSTGLMAGGLLGLALVTAVAMGSRPPRLAPVAPDAGRRASRSLPNVVLVVLDTVRRDHLSLYGYSRRTTPNLDRFAAEAVVFENAHAPGTYSLTSHASLFTGLLPHEHGAHPIPAASEADAMGGPRQYRLRDGVKTVAEEHRELGYVTAGISGNDIFLAEWTGLQRGFDDFVCQARRSPHYVPTVFPLMIRLLGEWAPRYLPYHDEWDAEVLIDAALQGIRGWDDRRFLLFLNLFDAHAPYNPRAPYDTMFPGFEADRRNRAAYVSQYDGEIAYTDAALGRLLDGLREAGRLKDTLVIVTSDHGEFLGEHGLWGHADQLREEVLRVPLIVRLPGSPAAARVTNHVGLINVAAMVRAVREGARTPSELAAAFPKEPLVTSESWGTRSEGVAPKLPVIAPRCSAVVFNRWKLVSWTGDRDDLFDLGADPGETRNLLENPTPEAKAIATLMRAAITSVARTGETGADPEVSPEYLERLRSLGYIK